MEGPRTLRAASLAAAAAALASAAPAGGGGPITGTWVAELDSQQGLPTDVYVVKDGDYLCESCRPRRRFPADGRMRSVAGEPGTSESVAIVDPLTVSTRTVRTDLDRRTRIRVASDGRSATYVSIDRRPGIRGLLRTEYLARRVAPGPAGSHAVSGTWRGIRYVSVPIQLRTTILADQGGSLSYRSGSGYRTRRDMAGRPSRSRARMTAACPCRSAGTGLLRWWKPGGAEARMCRCGPTRQPATGGGWRSPPPIWRPEPPSGSRLAGGGSVSARADPARHPELVSGSSFPPAGRLHPGC